MRLFLLTACSVVAAVGAYFVVLKPSAADHLTHILAEVAGPDGIVSLDACNLSLIVESAGREDSPIALTRIVIQADLRNYDFETVHFIPGSSSFGLRIDRGPVDDRMKAQTASIIDAGGERIEQLFSSSQIAKEILETEGSALSFRVMAEVVVTEEGSQKLIAHEDAPDFFRFTKTIESMATPMSYRSTTTFAPGGALAETLLTGEVVAIPFLQFSLASQDQAKELAHAFHDYTGENGCR